jgi:hypothetical protein
MCVYVVEDYYLKLGLAVGLKEDLLLMLLLNVATGLKRASLDCIHISSSTLIWLSTIPGVDLQRRPTRPARIEPEKCVAFIST